MMPAPSPRPSNEDRIKAALWFAERGFGVFPVWSTRDGGTCRCPAGGGCDSPGKHPIGTHGFKEATTEPGRIRTFLSAASEPNYGMLCPEGVVAWDVDSDAERERLARLETLHGPLPATLRTDEKGGDCVGTQGAGTFHGGKGFDWATVVTGGTQTEVEDIVSGLVCPVP